MANWSFCPLKFLEGDADRLKRELAKACILDKPRAPIAFLACSRLSVQEAAAQMYCTDQMKKCRLFGSQEGGWTQGEKY